MFNDVADFGEGFAHVVGLRLDGGEDLCTGFDLDGAIAAYGAYEFLDACVTTSAAAPFRAAHSTRARWG